MSYKGSNRMNDRRSLYKQLRVHVHSELYRRAAILLLEIPAEGMGIGIACPFRDLLHGISAIQQIMRSSLHADLCQYTDGPCLHPALEQLAQIAYAAIKLFSQSVQRDRLPVMLTHVPQCLSQQVRLNRNKPLLLHLNQHFMDKLKKQRSHIEMLQRICG